MTLSEMIELSGWTPQPFTMTGKKVQPTCLSFKVNNLADLAQACTEIGRTASEDDADTSTMREAFERVEVFPLNTAEESKAMIVYFPTVEW